ncbi:MAG: PAS domain S-box protein, partial [Planctomycetota bacterium]
MSHKSPNGEVEYLSTIIRDITERKEGEKALRISEEKFNKAFYSSPNAITISTLKEGRFIAANEAVTRVLGYAPDEFIGKTSAELRIWSLAEDRNKMVEMLKKDGKVQDQELQFRNKSGEIRHLVLSAEIIELEGEDCIVAATKDITERKRMEEAYRSLVDNSIQGLAIVQDGRMVFINKAFTSITGYSREDLLAASPEQLQSMVHPEDRELIWSRHRDRIAGKPVPARYEFRWIRKDGSTCWVEIYASRIEYQGRPAIQTTYIDITERKMAEEALKESEEKYRSLIANIPDVVWTTDQNGQTTFISSNIEKVYGYTPEDIYEEGERLWFGRIHPDDVERVKKAFEAVFEEEVQLDVEYRIRRKDGEWIWIHDRSVGAYEKNGIKYADGAFSDITEHKQAEEALFKEKKFTEDAINAQMDTFFLFDPGTGKAIRWNKAFKNISGYTDEEIVRMPAPASYYNPEDLERAAAFTQKVLKEGIGTIELELICKDGRKVPTEYRVSIINDEQGKPKYIISIGRDISERKRSEEKLRESEERLIKAFRASPNLMGIIDLDERRRLLVNDTFAHVTGYSVWETTGTTFDELNFWVEPDRVHEAFRFIRQNGLLQDYEADIRTKKGEIRTLRYHAALLDIPGKNLIAFSAEDTTERKKAEEALRKSEERFKILFESAPDAYYIHDLEGKYVDGNKAAVELGGYSREEAIGKSFFELGLVAEEDISKVNAAMADVRDGKPAGPLELTMYRKDRSKVFLETHQYPVEIVGQTVVL